MPDVIAMALDRVPVAAMMRHLHRITEFDRYQASTGLVRAAELVADAARAAGLAEVTVRSYPADGRAHWWTFAAPMSWTPLTARLRVSHGSRPVLDLDHARSPFAVATYSAPAAGVRPLVASAAVGDDPRVAGAVVVVPADRFRRGGFLADLVAAGAAGFVTDAPARTDHAGTLVAGRIELPPDCPLFAFSLTPAQLRVAREAARLGGHAEVTVEVDRTAPMPVVSAVLPGRGDREVWLTAHLCHPRPGANDNASGVAALLGVAEILAGMRGDWRPEHTIRFLWGPEYLGTVASLHDRARPAALINLDMVGEDQRRCGAPFVLERPPETIPTPLAPLAEHVVAEVFARTAAEPGRWAVEPFLGFSDHALVADPSVGSPSVQFCHPADRFNHSAADTVDAVAPGELRRAAACGAALARLVAGGDRIGLGGIVAAWCARETAAAERLAAAAPPDWARGLRAHVAAVTAAVRGAAPVPVPDRPDGGRPALRRRWPGPLNVRAMTADLPPGTRAALERLVTVDKLNLSLLFNFGIRVDGTRSREEIVEHTSYSLRRPLDRAVADRLVDAMVESGWVEEAVSRTGADAR